MSKAKTAEWTNRIIRYGEEAPDQLLAHEMNAFKIHPKNQQDAMSGMLNETGWLAPVIVSEATGKVIDGHMRVSLAISRCEASVPVAYVRLSASEEVAALATFDPVGSMMAYDKDELDALLREVSSSDSAVQAMLAELAAKQGLYGENDIAAEWQGMPEFEQEDKLGIAMTVRFETIEDKLAFGRLIGQALTEKTRGIWHPEQKPRDLKGYHCEDDES